MKDWTLIRTLLLMFLAGYISYVVGYNQAMEQSGQDTGRIDAKVAEVRRMIEGRYLTLVNNPQSLQEQIILDCVVYGDCAKATHLINE
tara:strand:+ start:3499 stop:3762 length:264 start_codon:yes stop_codon:yes gene_type:complete